MPNAVDALVECNVAIIDIPGAFMQADMVGNVQMKIEAG